MMQQSTSSQTARGREYMKTPGGATTKGQQYESGMVALLHLRSLNCADSFLLASNVDGLGQFDDIFLNLRWTDERTSQLCFIQLKHKDKGGRVTIEQLLHDKGNFSLLKYYKSYCMIEDMFTTPVRTTNNDIVDGNSLEDCIFILFTNSVVEHRSQNLNHSEFSTVEKILCTGDEKQDIFSFGPADYEIWKLREECEDCDRFHTFLNRLRIFSGQTHVDQLSQLVEQEVARCAQVEGRASDILCSSFLKSVEIWWNNDNTFLTECSLLWTEALRRDLNTNLIESLQKVGYQFKPGNNIFLEGENYAYLNLVVPGVDFELRCLKIWAQLEEKYKDRYLLLNNTEFILRKKPVSFLCEKGLCDVLVIETQDNVDVVQHLFNNFQQGPCKVVLVSGRKLEPVDSPRLSYEEDVWSMDHLTEDSRARILSRTVEFQGEDVSLVELGDCDVSVKVLGTLLRGGKVIVGSALEGVDKLYLNRILRHQTVLQEEVLLETHLTDIFAISGFPQDRHLAHDMVVEYSGTFKNLKGSNVVLSYADSSTVQQSFASVIHHPDKNLYLELCDKFKSIKNVHWVVYEGGNLTWRESYGVEETPCRYIHRMSASCEGGTSCYHGEGLAADWRERLRLITGVPGMGKSTLLHHLAAEIKKKNPASWIVHVTLNNFSSTLKNMPAEEMTLEQVVQLLLQAAKGDKSTCPELSRKLLLNGLKQSGNVTVLLDAVDEVSPTYVEQVVRIVQLLLLTEVFQLWVTSRTVLQHLLQWKLSSLPLVLQPFTDEQQQAFLTQYLAQEVADGSVNEQQLNVQAVELLKLINTKGTHANRNICDVPLHAKMTADTVKQLMKDAPGSTNYSESFHHLNLHHIYENFINIKRALYYEKYKVDATQSAMLDTIEREEEYFIDNHMKCALVVMFSPHECKLFNILDFHKDIQTFLTKIVHEKTGIITGVIDDKPQFVHFTFVEYLVAKWFKKYYENQNYVTINAGLWQNIWRRFAGVKLFSRYGSDNPMQLLLNEKFDVTRLFFDQMVSDNCRLHQAVLIGNTEHVGFILDSGARVDELDQGERLALHLAVAYRHSEIVNLLLNAGSPVDLSDKVLGWCPLQYADRVQSLHIAIQMLLHGAKERDMPILKGKMEDNILWHTIISAVRNRNSEIADLVSEMGADVASYNSEYTWRCAMKLGRSRLIQLLIDNGADVNSPCRWRDTPLILAIGEGDKEIVQLLIANKADINKTGMLEDTPLILAMEKNNKDIVQLLIANKADVNKLCSEGYTPLILAIKKCDKEIVQLLLANKADANKPDRWCKIPLIWAIEVGDKEVVQLLIANEADVNADDWITRTPLMSAIEQVDKEIVQLLIANKADVNRPNKLGDTPLILAIEKSDKEIVQLLIANEADVNKPDRWKAPIISAVIRGDKEVVQLLLTKEADVNITDSIERTPLILATMKGDKEIAQLLIAKKADVNKADEDMKTPLMWATEIGDRELVLLLLTNKANVNETDIL